MLRTVASDFFGWKLWKVWCKCDVNIWEQLGVLLPIYCCIEAKLLLESASAILWCIDDIYHKRVDKSGNKNMKEMWYHYNFVFIHYICFKILTFQHASSTVPIPVARSQFRTVPHGRKIDLIFGVAGGRRSSLQITLYMLCSICGVNISMSLGDPFFIILHEHKNSTKNRVRHFVSYRPQIKQLSR